MDQRLLIKALQPNLCVEGVRDDWFDAALDYLSVSADANGWHVLMYGA